MGQMHAEKMKGNRNRREFFSWVEFRQVLSCKLVTGLWVRSGIIKLISFAGQATLPASIIFNSNKCVQPFAI
jgi:hypothetical protein